MVSSTAGDPRGVGPAALCSLRERGCVVTDVEREADLAEVRRLNESWNDVYRLNERERFAEILADDLTVTLPDGRRGGKAEMMQPTDKRKVTFSEHTLELFGHTAVTSGRVLIEHPEGPVDQRFVRVWARRKGRWQAVSVFAFLVPSA